MGKRLWPHTHAQKKITLRVDLRGNALERLLALKEKYGLENDTELIRLLVSKEHERNLTNKSN